MKIAMPTIMHTGNRFLWALLEEKYGVRVPANREQEGKPQILQEHINCYVPLLHVAPDPNYVLVIPLRHPRAVAVSHEARQRSADQAMREYRIMIDEYDKYDPYYVPVDSPYRDKFLAELNERLGEDLVTDWEPVAEMKGNANFDYTMPSEYECVEELCRDKADFLSRFYGSG